jgi:NDP-sugar pyrophosphorylase family protein
MRRSVVELMPPQGIVSLEKEIFPKLIAGGMAALVTKQRFYDIGTPERLAAIEELLAAGRRK